MSLPKPHQLKSFSNRQRMSPLPNYMSMASVCREMKKYVGATLRDVVLIFQGNIMYGFVEPRSHDQAGQTILRRIRKDPRLYHKLVVREDKLGLILVRFAQSAGAEAARSSDRELAGFSARFEKLYKEVYACYGSVWTIEGVLVNELIGIVEKRGLDQEAIAVAVNTLTRQPSAMVATIERLALLKLGKTIAAQSDEKKVAQLVERHLKKFFWITRDYEDPILTFEKMQERLREVLQKNPAKEYKQLAASLRRDVAEQRALAKHLKLTIHECALFSIMRDAAHLKELRKTYVSQALYYFDPVLEEIAHRCFLSVKQVRFMKPSEVTEALLKKKDFTHELNDRFRLSVWHTEDGSTTTITTGKVADEMFRKLCTLDQSTTEFSGMPVSPGVARGPAKIVLNPNECNKVEVGDIIVSIQVVPSFSTAILKAGGLVCDGGHGITSHPATLAREAKIPGVIQTRFVREVVKDGDIIEVNGTTGVVKIIQKK